MTLSNIDASAAVAITSAALAVFFGIAAWAQARKANKLAARVAEAQGTFAKPTIEIKLFGVEIEQLIVAVPLKRGRILTFPLPFSIRNTSDKKSARDLEVFVKMPKALLGDEVVFESGVKKVSGGVVHETKYLRTLGTTFETLHPEQGCEMPIMVALAFETSRIVNISDVETKDGVRVNLGVRLEFEIMIELWATQLDQKGVAKSFGISVVDTSKTGIEEFFREHNRRLAKARQERPHGLLRRLFLQFVRMKPLWAKQVYLVECRQEDVIPTDAPLIDTVRDGATLKVRVGIETDRGYMIPGMPGAPGSA